jgi:glycosyltransferase involved in cell wall biosynthesis
MSNKAVNNLTKKKLLFVCRLYVPHVGGVEKHVQELSYLLKTEYDITILTEQYDSSLPEQEILNEIKIIRIPNNVQGKFKMWRWIWQHRDLFFKSDIIHIHDVGWWIIPLLPKLFKKYFMTFHGYEHENGPTVKQILLRKGTEVCAKGTIAVGAWMKKWYWANPDVITYGAVYPYNKHEQKQKNSAAFVGRLEQNTGLLDYIHAFKQLPNWTLHIYGEGILQTKIPNTKNIIYHGITLDPYRALAQAEIACVSQYLAILEAASVGTSIIAHVCTPLKRDYMNALPIASSCTIVSTPEEIVSAVKQRKPLESFAQQWAQQQTWEQLAHIYRSLWKK